MRFQLWDDEMRQIFKAFFNEVQKKLELVMKQAKKKKKDLKRKRQKCIWGEKYLGTFDKKFIGKILLLTGKRNKWFLQENFGNKISFGKFFIDEILQLIGKRNKWFLHGNFGYSGRWFPAELIKLKDFKKFK